MYKTTRGFTLVELLIVIVVIAILAVLAIVAYNGVQQRAIESKIKQDVAQLIKSVQLAQVASGKTLVQISGVDDTPRSCLSQPSGTDLASLPKTHACWVAYYALLDKISNAAGIGTLRNLVDPWGRPYYIDENEGQGGVCNSRDSIGAYERPLVSNRWAVYPTTSLNNVPYSDAMGCS